MALRNFWFRVISLLIPFDKKNIEISYICTVVTIMGKQCWGQAVLELGSWGHSVLQTPALFFLCFVFCFFVVVVFFVLFFVFVLF